MKEGSWLSLPSCEYVKPDEENEYVLHRTIRETLIPTILFPEEMESVKELNIFEPEMESHPTFAKAMAKNIAKQDSFTFQLNASQINPPLKKDQNIRAAGIECVVHQSIPTSKRQLKLDRSGNVINKSKSQQKSSDVHNHAWENINRIGPIQTSINNSELDYNSDTDIIPSKKKQRKKHKSSKDSKKRKKSTKKNKNTSCIKNSIEKLLTSQNVQNSLNSNISEKDTAISSQQILTSNVPECTTQGQKSKTRTKKRQLRKENKEKKAEQCVSPLEVNMTEEAFNGIEEFEIYNVANSHDSLNAFLDMIDDSNADYITWTVIYCDANLSTPLLPSCLKYCTEKGPKCEQWNCICEHQVRAMQAKNPIFGVMFVFSQSDKDRADENDLDSNVVASTSTVDHQTNSNINNQLCFILPLGPTISEKSDQASLPSKFHRMLKWPSIPFSCEVSIEQRWDTLQKVLLQNKYKCVTFNAGVTLMPYHFHRIHDHGKPPDLILPSIRDLKLAAWMLRPHTSEQELELEKFYIDYPYCVPKENCKNTDIVISNVLASILKTKENLIFLYNVYPMVKRRIHQNKLNDALDHIESPLQSILSTMECEGIGFNSSLLTSGESKVEDRLLEILSQARTITNNPDLLLSSPQQVSSLLFDQLEIAYPAEVAQRMKLASDSKHRSTSNETLNLILSSFPPSSSQYHIIKLILEYRELNKFLTSFLRPLPYLSRPIAGLRSKKRKIHPMWQQTAVRTGRLSCRKPNLQQVPSDTVSNIVCRSAFVPTSSDKCFFACDYSQNEVRILSHMSGDKELIAMFHGDEVDIYKQMSSALTGKKVDDVTPDERSISKQVTLAILYGMGVAQVAKKLNVDKQKAYYFFNSFFRRFRGVKRWIEETKAFARKNGYVCTISGRRRYLTEICSTDDAKKSQAERQAVNSIIQGSAADLIKMAMIKIGSRIMDWHKEGINTGGTGKPPTLLLQIHDELLFEVTNNKDDLARLRDTVVRCCGSECEKELKLSVPLKLKCSVGPDWGKLQVLDGI